ncbi:hypothetical protein F0562_008072 [Nyssa sinensis]|uniref:Uncharacterized protein n=1 Tax=Nyssa sinensis TaxID=561372 RepID=A0A5J5A7F7_9ASTE|nr:hypothetical protein F0562_008072 [Nyssa sinensis]
MSAEETALLQGQDQPMQDFPAHPKQGVAQASHDQLCDLMHRQLQYYDEDLEDDLFKFKISVITGSRAPAQMIAHISNGSIEEKTKKREETFFVALFLFIFWKNDSNVCIHAT